MKTPRGFFFNGIRAGIKKRGKDLGIIISEKPALAIGFFTTNEFKSESLLVCQEHIKAARARAIIVTSGNANSATGLRGRRDARNLTSLCARELGIKKEEVLIASTGKIGLPLPYRDIAGKIRKLIQSSSQEKILDFTQAIMTTDSYPKYLSLKLKSGVRIIGFAKGAGMIAPDFDTTLCFLLTDAEIRKATLRKILREHLNLTFNRISIDGEQSTNDTIIALANGASGIKVEESKIFLLEFIEGMFSLLSNLAYMIVKDGEGATKVIELRIRGARNKFLAERIARRLAGSMLFKSSIYGNSANWGRIIACIGSLKLGLARNFNIYYGKYKVVNNGVSLYKKKALVEEYLRNNNKINVEVDLKSGKSEFWLYTTDLSPEYVEVNK